MEDFIDPFNGRTGVYQFTMSHLESGMLFRDGNDYVFGVNTLALATIEYDIVLLCYILMTDHLHVLMQGVYSDCLAAYQWIIRRLRRMLNERYGIRGIPRPSDFNVTAVTNRTTLQNEVLYIIRNCYKARMASPLSYPWSSADCYFNGYRDLIQGKRFDTMSTQEPRAVLQSHTKVPGNWEHLDGRVLNKSFVSWEKVERCFGDSLRFFDGLRLWDLETAVRLSHGIADALKFTDEELQDRVKQICQQEYHVSSFQQLDNKTLLILARTLARRYSAGKAQIGRLLNIRQEMLDKVL